MHVRRLFFERNRDEFRSRFQSMEDELQSMWWEVGTLKGRHDKSEAGVKAQQGQAGALEVVGRASEAALSATGLETLPRTRI